MKNHDFTPKNLFFSNFRGGARRVRPPPPPGSAPAATRNIVIGRLHAGESQNTVARLYNVQRSTISRILQRYQKSGSTADRHRSGRPRITSAAQNRYIRVLHLRNRSVTARETAGLRRISTQSEIISMKTAYFGAVLRRQHRLPRVRWCNRVRGWDLQN